MRLGVCMLLILMGGAGSLWSQGTVKGFVTAEDDGAPVLFAAVVLEGTTFGVSTDTQGYYSLSKVPAGTYTLVVSSVEYAIQRTEVVVLDDRVVTKNMVLKSGLVELQDAVISTERGEQLNTVRMSVESIQPSDIKRIPSLGGTPDLVQVLQTLPGFVSTGDQGGQLYIRGGSPFTALVCLACLIPTSFPMRTSIPADLVAVTGAELAPLWTYPPGMEVLQDCPDASEPAPLVANS